MSNEDQGMDVVPDKSLSKEEQDAVNKLCEMGYTEEQSRRALTETKSVEAALEWLVNHGDSTDSQQVRTAKSYRCVDTGKLFRTLADAQIYAEKTGHSNFEETDIEIPPLTSEEKAERLKKVKELIKVKVAQREENEKREALDREKARRAGGREMSKIREEQEALQRQRDAEARDREKQRFEAEAKKLREQVARDKAERAMEKATRLGLGDPKEAYDKAYAAAVGKADQGEKTPEERADACLSVIEAFRVGGKGLECLTTIIKLLNNVVSNPSELKYRKINLANETIKAKIVSVQGGVALLKAAGFEQSLDDSNSLILSTDGDLERVVKVLDRAKVSQSRLAL